MKITPALATVGYAISNASAQERGATFGKTSSRLLMVDVPQVETTASSSPQKGIFSKVSKSSKSSKNKGKSSNNDKSKQPLFDKSGKNKSDKEATVNNEPPHKLFNKSRKGKSSKNTKKGKSSKAGKSKSEGGHLFPKSGKSEISEGYDFEDESGEHLPWEEDESSELDDEVDDIVASTNTSPTPQPICNSNTVQDDFNLCIAIDASGSVCSGRYSLDCTNCSPSIFCLDAGYERNTCCANYAKVKQFSSEVVTALEEIDVEKSFSIVQFSTDADVESELSTGSETLPVIDGMKYSGGWTNHAAAVKACQQTFDVSDDRRDFILLITDGVSTAPQYLSSPEGAAEEAAELAKEDRISIIPIFISAQYDADALAFMSRLSSDGRVFDVTGFESLDSLQGSLVNQVSCTTVVNAVAGNEADDSIAPSTSSPTEVESSKPPTSNPMNLGTNSPTGGSVTANTNSPDDSESTEPPTSQPMSQSLENNITINETEPNTNVTANFFMALLIDSKKTYQVLDAEAREVFEQTLLDFVEETFKDFCQTTLGKSASTSDSGSFSSTANEGMFRVVSTTIRAVYDSNSCPNRNAADFALLLEAFIRNNTEAFVEDLSTAEMSQPYFEDVSDVLAIAHLPESYKGLEWTGMEELMKNNTNSAAGIEIKQFLNDNPDYLSGCYIGDYPDYLSGLGLCNFLISSFSAQQIILSEREQSV